MFCDGQDGQTSYCYGERRKGPPKWYYPSLEDEAIIKVSELERTIKQLTQEINCMKGKQTKKLYTGTYEYTFEADDHEDIDAVAVQSLKQALSNDLLRIKITEANKH